MGRVVRGGLVVIALGASVTVLFGVLAAVGYRHQMRSGVEYASVPPVFIGGLLVGACVFAVGVVIVDVWGSRGGVGDE